MNFKNTISLWAAVMIISAGGAYAQIKKKTTPAHKATTPAKQTAKPVAMLPTDPDVIIGKLPNGLTYYIRSNSQPQHRADIFLVNKVGSVLETDAQQGLANFIEHMAFNGTRDFSKSELTKYLQSTHLKFGPDQSAFTSYDETLYQLSLPTDTLATFQQGFKLLANWAAYISFNPEDLTSLKTSLSQEVALGGKTAQDRIQLQTLPLLLNNSKYAQRSPAGKAANISTFNDAMVKGFYTDWYRPDMQAIIAVGDFDAKDVEAMIKFNFSALRNPAPQKPQPQLLSPGNPGTVVKIVTEKDFPYTLVQYVVKHPQTISKTVTDFVQIMRVNLFNQMLNNRISDVAQEPSSPMAFGQAGYGIFAGKQDAFTALGVASQNGLQGTVKAIATEAERVRRFGFTVTELERAKQAVLTQITNNYNQRDHAPSASFAAQYERNFLTGQAIPGIDYEYNYYLNNIGKIGVPEMNALAAKLISDQNRVVLVEASANDKDKLPNEQTLLKWITDAEKSATPYVDEYNTESLMPHAPSPGTVTALKVDSTLLVTNITLSNGVKVILKPTDFRNDQVLISGYSLGGTSLANEQDITSANMSADVISNSGVGDFTPDRLAKILKRKSLNISPYISDITQGMSGYSSPADFETAMQLIYLYFTAPRKDDAAWQANVNQIKSLLAHKNNDPGSVYQDTVLAVLGSYNPRIMPVTLDKLNTASEDKAYNFFKDRFADASGFTFTFTGAFAVDNIMPYIICYLGNLPSTKSNETYKNWNIHPPTGQITKTVYKGVSDKATVQLIYSGSYEYNELNNVQMDALEDVLNTRLADSLKKESGIYSSGVRASYLKIPDGRYKVTISFLCDAGNVDKSIDLMQTEINKIKQNGPVAKDVRLFSIRDARGTQQQLRDNTFWETTLVSGQQNQQDPDRILYHIQNLGQVTPESVKDAANKYLNNSNFIKLILLPEKK